MTKYILQSEKNNAEMTLLNEMQDCLTASMTVKCSRLGYIFNQIEIICISNEQKSLTI